jgi:hypothetical protein
MAEVAKGGGSDRVAAAQALGTAVRRCKSGDGSKATGCTGTATNDAVNFLTSLRGSWAITRRRSGGGTEESTAAALEFRRRAEEARAAARALVGAPGARRP